MFNDNFTLDCTLRCGVWIISNSKTINNKTNKQKLFYLRIKVLKKKTTLCTHLILITEQQNL